MIDHALGFLKDQLNASLKEAFAADGSEAEKDLVLFVDGDKMDPLSFPSGAASILLVNVEQEKTMRRADPFRGAAADNPNTPVRINPEIRLVLSVLFAARFKQYEVGLKILSGIVQFFQEHPVFRGSDAAPLPSGIKRLAVEQASLPLAAQNEIWSALRTTYHPSVLYRVSMLVIRDRAPVISPAIGEGGIFTQTEQIESGRADNGEA